MKETVAVSTKQVEVRVTTYQCDHCEFSSTNKNNVRVHNANEHLCKETKPDPHQYESFLYRFHSKEDAQEWLDATYEHRDYYTQDNVSWVSPGLYKIQHFTDILDHESVRLVFDYWENEREHLSQMKVGDTYTDSDKNIWALVQISSSGLIFNSDESDSRYVGVVIDSLGKFRVSSHLASEDVIDYALKLWKNRNDGK
jgi:hypothetical protein